MNLRKLLPACLSPSETESQGSFSHRQNGSRVPNSLVKKARQLHLPQIIEDLQRPVAQEIAFLGPQHLIWVVGAKATPIGELSPAQQTRVEKAEQIWRHSPHSPVLFTGGVTQLHTASSEAALMAAALIARVGPQATLWLEPHAQDTPQNAWYSALLARERETARGFPILAVTVVCEPYQMVRAISLLRASFALSDQALPLIRPATAGSVPAPEDVMTKLRAAARWAHPSKRLDSTAAPQASDALLYMLHDRWKGDGGWNQ